MLLLEVVIELPGTAKQKDGKCWFLQACEECCPGGGKV